MLLFITVILYLIRSDYFSLVEPLRMNYAIILAGGTGTRTGLSFPKQFAMLAGKTVIETTISAFESVPAIDGIVLICHPDHIPILSGIIDGAGFTKIRGIFPGGKTRQESSFNGINAIPFNSDDIILLHDAARPFVSQEIITRVIDSSIRYGASLPAIPPTDSLFTVSGDFMTGQIDRQSVFCAQTPQGFRHKVILEAHRKAIDERWNIATDDAGLATRAGTKVHVVEGNDRNIKITTANDLILAEAMMKEKC